ncbi:MAG: hypothetical protein M1818_002068 [Claussenomyces sp. TS43310]|nr:MAG: hypothetical protein M1818_002068 [Claussenomyces sp. TS43310]
MSRVLRSAKPVQSRQDGEEVLIRADDETPQGSTVLTPSFNGRLNISDFAFSPKLTAKHDEGGGSPRPYLPKRKSSTSLIPSTSPVKKSRPPSGYAPPSKYAYLPPLPDILEPNLLVVFVGLNPGVETARAGHAYAHPSNLFWKLLYSSGCTTRRCLPTEDRDLPRLFGLGNTNIVSRPTRNGAELSKQEMDDSVGELEAKIKKYKPDSVCIVGKSIWESVWRVRHGKPIKKEEFKWGWQDPQESMGVDEEWEGAKIFVATSTSGLAASLLPHEKERIWRELGLWVEQRRESIALAGKAMGGVTEHQRSGTESSV